MGFFLNLNFKLCDLCRIRPKTDLFQNPAAIVTNYRQQEVPKNMLNWIVRMGSTALFKRKVNSKFIFKTLASENMHVHIYLCNLLCAWIDINSCKFIFTDTGTRHNVWNNPNTLKASEELGEMLNPTYLNGLYRTIWI